MKTGGAEKQAIQDANSLVLKKCDVTIAFHQRGELENLIDPSISTIHIRCKNILLASMHLTFTTFYMNFDVIHAHMFWAQKIAFVSTILKSRRLIFNEHGLGLWRKWYHRTIMKWISRKAERIICSCEENLRFRLIRDHLPPDRLQVIYNAFPQDSTSSHHQKDQFTDRFVIGFTGRFHAVKRLDSFFYLANKLVSQLPNILFLLVGDGEQWQKIRNQVIEKKMDKYFFLPGFTRNPSEYYSLMDLYVLPSRIEGFSVSLLEAAAAGIPSIAFNVGGNHEIIITNNTGYLIPESNLDLMAQKIIHLFKDNDLRKKLGINARKMVQTQFSNNERINKLVEVYFKQEKRFPN